MEQMMELLLTKMEEAMAKIDKIETNGESIQEQILARMDASHKDMMAETLACQKDTEVRLEGEEPIAVDMEPEAARQVPKEDSAMMPVGGPKKRCLQDATRNRWRQLG
jgi:hypothetical protein